MMLPKPTKSITVLLSQTMYDELKESAHRDCRSLSSQIRQILKEYLRVREKKEEI